jgi:septum site-determining protein MinC
MLNNIRISQTTNEIILTVNFTANINEVLEELQLKLPRLREFYQTNSIPIKVTGRIFNQQEMDKIRGLILSQIKVEINFDEASDLLGLHAIKKTFEADTDISETKFIQNSLRSGKREEYPGSIVVCGDVNAGAEIIAGGNILILGALRGLAHAGANGNTMAFISANYIEPTQIRISNLVREVGEKIEKCPICKIDKNEIIII